MSDNRFTEDQLRQAREEIEDDRLRSDVETALEEDDQAVLGRVGRSQLEDVVGEPETPEKQDTADRDGETRERDRGTSTDTDRDTETTDTVETEADQRFTEAQLREARERADDEMLQSQIDRAIEQGEDAALGRVWRSRIQDIVGEPEHVEGRDAPVRDARQTREQIEQQIDRLEEQPDHQQMVLEPETAQTLGFRDEDADRQAVVRADELREKLQEQQQEIETGIQEFEQDINQQIQHQTQQEQEEQTQNILRERIAEQEQETTQTELEMMGEMPEDDRTRTERISDWLDRREERIFDARGAADFVEQHVGRLNTVFDEQTVENIQEGAGTAAEIAVGTPEFFETIVRDQPSVEEMGEMFETAHTGQIAQTPEDAIILAGTEEQEAAQRSRDAFHLGIALGGVGRGGAGVRTGGRLDDFEMVRRGEEFQELHPEEMTGTGRIDRRIAQAEREGEFVPENAVRQAEAQFAEDPTTTTVGDFIRGDLGTRTVDEIRIQSPQTPDMQPVQTIPIERAQTRTEFIQERLPDLDTTRRGQLQLQRIDQETTRQAEDTTTRPQRDSEEMFVDDTVQDLTTRTTGVGEDIQTATTAGIDTEQGIAGSPTVDVEEDLVREPASDRLTLETQEELEEEITEIEPDIVQTEQIQEPPGIEIVDEPETVLTRPGPAFEPPGLQQQREMQQVMQEEVQAPETPQGIRPLEQGALGLTRGQTPMFREEQTLMERQLPEQVPRLATRTETVPRTRQRQRQRTRTQPRARRAGGLPIPDIGLGAAMEPEPGDPVADPFGEPDAEFSPDLTAAIGLREPEIGEPPEDQPVTGLEGRPVFIEDENEEDIFDDEPIL